MSKLLNIIVISIYAAVALSVGYAFPDEIFDLDVHAPWLLGGMLFLISMLSHEIFARLKSEAKSIQRLLVLRRAYDAAQAELVLIRDEIKRIYEAIEKFGSHSDDGGRGLEEVATEVKVLHALVEELYSTGSHPDYSLPPLPKNIDDKEVFDDNLAFSGPAKNAPMKLSESDMLEIMRDALRKNRVDLYLQPIVRLPEREHQFFECFSAVRNDSGEIITPDRYIEIAKKSGLIKAIDNMLLFRCIQLIKKVHAGEHSTNFFCHVSPSTRTDREFFHEFQAFLERNEEIAPSIIFEFSQEDIAAHPEEVMGDINSLSRTGYRFCVNQIVNLDFDSTSLSELGFQFIKLDASTLLSDNLVSENIVELKQSLDSAGIQLIVEKIETEQMLTDLLTYNIAYGQGNLLGEPRLSQVPQSLTPLTAGDRP